MEPDKENKENNVDKETTVNVLHDSGIDIVEAQPASQGNEFSPGEAPKLDPSASVPKMPPIQPISPIAPMQPVGNRPSAQNVIDGVLGIGSVKTVGDISKNDPSIKPLRTFKTDAEEAVKYNNVSKINMVVAEQKRREVTPAGAPNSTPIEYEGENKSSKIILIILVILILGVIGGGAYYWFFVRVPTAVIVNNVPKGLVVKTPIAYDKIDTLTMDAGKDALALISTKLTATDVPIGQVYALLLLPPGTTTVTVNPASLFTGTHMPDRLSRSIAGNYMVGSYFSTANGPFMIFKNTFFQNSFAGMLEWEKDMRNDLISLIRVTYPNQVMVETNNDIFSDQVVSNVNARVLKGADGKVVLAYAFADTSTIVIATNTDTLKYVVDKLLAVRVVQ